MVLVLALMRDNAAYVGRFAEMVAALGVPTSCHVLENDSADDTRAQLTAHGLTVHGQATGAPPAIDQPCRCRYLAALRNTLKTRTDHLPRTLVLLVDSNIEFTRETFLAMRETLDRRPDIAMVTPHGRARHGLPCDFHYDTYATIYRDGTHFGPFTNLFPCTSTTHHVRHCHRADGEPPLQNMTRLIDLQSAFGGFVLVRPQAFREARWSVSCCPDGMPRSSKWAHDIEHWRFCDHIRSHGRIVMDTRASVTWWE